MKPVIRIALVLFSSLAVCAGVCAESDPALLAADAAWSKSAGTENKDAFFATFLSDATLLAPHQPIASGIEAVSASFQGIFDLPGFGLTWEPLSAQISGSGDLGYTIGTYELKFDDPDGKPTVDIGKYMTVWKKQADGSWKVAADMFNSDL